MSNVSHPISLYKFSIDTNFVAPVAILAASVWIFSTFSYCMQLAQISFPYSKIGLIKEVYIISNDFRLSFRIIFILFHAFFFM